MCRRNLTGQFRTYRISHEPGHEWVRRILAGGVASRATDHTWANTVRGRIPVAAQVALDGTKL